MPKSNRDRTPTSAATDDMSETSSVGSAGSDAEEQTIRVSGPDPISKERRERARVKAKEAPAAPRSSGRKLSLDKSAFRVSAGSIAAVVGSLDASERSGKSRKHKRRSNRDVRKDQAEDEEEAEFLKVLDLLEEHDEFDAASSSGDSEAGSDSDYDDNDSDASVEDNLATNPERRKQFDAWGPLEAWELAAAANDLRQRKMPHPSVSARIIRDVGDLYAKSPTLVHIDRPPHACKLIIVGDLHGHFADLMHIFDEHGDPTPGPNGTIYLFNGDLVDRGEWGPEVLLLVYTLKLQFPNHVHINRGNHEDEQQNRLTDNGFRDQHCNRVWKLDGRGMYALCRWSFKQLPLMHVVANEIAVMHGGLPLDKSVTLHEINQIDRKHRVPISACNILGYPKGQKVKAKGELVNEELEAVEEGTMGRISRRMKTSPTAIVRFGDVEVEVDVFGAPEIEQDIEIYFETKQQQQKQRQQRIFTALLWSDPCKPGRSAPSKRGVGSYFDEKISRDFLHTNNLGCIVRSHEKRSQGYANEHVCSQRGVLTATVFSASNYPSGAGEPSGNKASVIVLPLTPGRGKLSLPQDVSAWRETYTQPTRFFTRASARDDIINKLSHIELEEDAPQVVESARVRVLKKLRSMVYCARPGLISFWNRIDAECTGFVTAYEWALAMRACVVPDEDFPWEWLMPHMTHTDEYGNCHYATFLNRYDNLLLRRLAERWHGGAVASLAPGVRTRDEAEAAWSRCDRDGNGKLTYQELRPILRFRGRAGDGPQIDSAADDDRVYSILQSLDKDRSGFVDKEEFINAVMTTYTRKSLLESAAELTEAPAAPRGLAAGRQSIFASAFALGGASSTKAFGQRSSFDVDSSQNSTGGIKRRTSIQLDKELAKASEAAITQCWLAAQSALRALSAARCSLDSVFKVLDADNDGDIDRQEFRDGLVQLIHDQDIIQSLDKWEPLLWKLVDEDNSGAVSHAELSHLLTVREIVSV
mmetsp:Transcript_56238/g.162931  ORF Transcript_56238/g.162931 Transcript_56238/m.162931 type:complete len:983 (+) Transcript_56238:174-3122(+)